MRICVLVAIWFLSFYCYAQSTSQNLSVFLKEQSTTFSETVPIKLFDDDLEGGSFPDPGNNAITFNRLMFGIDYRGFTLGYFFREDYAFNFSTDTFNLIYMDKNDVVIPDGQRFDIYLHALHLKASGMHGAFEASPNEALDITFGINLFRAEELLNGDIRGALVVNNGRIEGDLILDYYHQEDYVLGRKVNAIAEGKGYSFDLELDLQLSKRLRMTHRHFDLFGKIYWQTAPRTMAAVSTTTIYADADGRQRRAPVMSGRSSYGKADQRLPKHYVTSFIYSVSDGMHVGYIGERYEQVLFNRLMLGFPFFSTWQVNTGYDFTTDAPWFGIDSDYFSIDVSTDSLTLAKSKAITLNLQARYRF